MSKFTDHTGKESLMRKLIWLITIISLIWGTAELIAYMILTKYEIAYEVHTGLILGAISLAITGKGAQKWIEFKNGKDEGS